MGWVPLPCCKEAGQSLELAPHPPPRTPQTSQETSQAFVSEQDPGEEIPASWYREVSSKHCLPIPTSHPTGTRGSSSAGKG